MPEGPEIRRAADRLAKVLLGQRLVDVSLTVPELARYERRLDGARVTSIAPRGKAMLIGFDNALTLYSHNQLYGRWYVVKRDRWPRTNRQLRVALHTDTHSALLYSATDIAVLNKKQLASHPFLVKLGPDILDPQLVQAKLCARLEDGAFARRSLAALYLDQGFLAGVGNYLRAEILWAARVNPRARPADLSTAAIKRLANQTLSVSRRAYRQRGITVGPALLRTLRNKGLRYSQYRFHAYGRKGRPCYRCDQPIERAELAGRSLYFCPKCQA